MADFNTPKMIKSNGIEMAVYEEGEGLPIVFCHGWPELAYSWRSQVSALAGAGFRAIAPDQRGYGRTVLPTGLKDEDFDIFHLADDLIGLLDHYGIEKAVFCGHDWGGFVVWHMAIAHPDRVAGVASVCTPFNPRREMDPIALMRQIFTDKMYIVQFNDRDQPEDAFEADVEKVFKTLWRKGGMSTEEYQEATKGRPTFDIFEALKAPAEMMPGEEILEGDDLAYYVNAFSNSGFRGGINWYRNFTRNWELTAELPQRVTMPALMVTAENDRVLPPSAAAHMGDHCDDLETHLIEDTGHWVQAEQPEALNTVLTDWMIRRFG